MTTTTWADPVDFEAYGTIYQPRGIPQTSADLSLGAYPFRGRIGAAGDPDAEFPAEPGRYHLYVSYACPFAQRTLIVRALKGLEDVVGVSVVDPIRDGRGWAFREGPRLTGDAAGNGFAFLKEAYDATVAGSYGGRVSVPVLWDTATRRIVSNYFPDITLDLGNRFDQWAGVPDLDLYPVEHRAEIDALARRIQTDVNTGVYAAGFATDQATYEDAVARVFAALADLEERLSGHDHLVGDRLTEADVRLWVTLARFDAVYHGHFKCNWRRLTDHPRLWAYARRLYALPAFRDTTDLDQIKRHYYGTQLHLNPTGIVPTGPLVDWTERD